MHLNTTRHPISWVLGVLSELNTDEVYLDFSEYNYKPRTIFDEREEFSLKLSSLGDSFLFKEIFDLSNNEELAIHSSVNVDGKYFHLPMVDFGNKKYHGFKTEAFYEFFEVWGVDFSIYDSGRSFHAYGNKLLTRDQWVEFMGTLLLLNIPGKPKIIDDRWVGHRLLSGYSSLRWTNNSGNYKKVPEYIGMFSNMLNG